MDAFNKMGVSAYTLGERDLALGVDHLQQLARRATFPILAANLVNGDGEPVFKSSIILALRGIKVGVVGLLGERAALPHGVLEDAGLRLLPPAEVAKKESERLTAQGVDLLVALSHLGHGEERTVAAAAPAIQFFVGSHAARRSPAATEIPRSEGAPAYGVDAGSRGKYVGRLEIYPAAGKDGLTRFVDAGQRQMLEKRLGQRERSLTTARGRLAQLTAQAPVSGQEARHQSRVEATQRSIDRLEKQIAAERAQLSAPRPSFAERPVFVNHIDGMELNIAEREDLREAVAALEASGLLAPVPRKVSHGPARRPPGGK